MTRERDQDGSFVRLGDVVARIAEVVRAKRRKHASSTGRVIDLDAAPRVGLQATVAALAVLSEEGVIDPGTGARLLRRILTASDTDPGQDVRDRPEAP